MSVHIQRHPTPSKFKKHVPPNRPEEWPHPHGTKTQDVSKAVLLESLGSSDTLSPKRWQHCPDSQGTKTQDVSGAHATSIFRIDILSPKSWQHCPHSHGTKTQDVLEAHATSIFRIKRHVISEMLATLPHPRGTKKEERVNELRSHMANPVS
jgi:hypothetical protein